MSADQIAALQEFKQLVHHSPADIWIAVLGVVAMFGLIVLFVTRQRPRSQQHREQWQHEDPRRDLWSRYFRGRWYVS
jgi:hypothetical protein